MHESHCSYAPIKSTTPQANMGHYSLVPRPSDWGGGGGGGEEGLVSIACACAVIIQILNNPVTICIHLQTLLR